MKQYTFFYIRDLSELIFGFLFYVKFYCYAFYHEYSCPTQQITSLHPKSVDKRGTEHRIAP